MAATDREVLKLWIRPREVAASETVDGLELATDKGVVGDHTFGRLRHVTLVFEDDWALATQELGVDVDPQKRRANVLLSGGGGEEFLKKRLRIGDIIIEIKGITAPCPVMDQASQGLLDALRPGARAGIWGRVVNGGHLHVGDVVQAEEIPEGS